MPFPYLGTTARTYPQYRDTAADTVLRAGPGGSYDMAPAGSLTLTVPPADGLWGEQETPAAQPAAPAPEPAVPAALITPPAPENEES